MGVVQPSQTDESSKEHPPQGLHDWLMLQQAEITISLQRRQIHCSGDYYAEI